LNQKLSKTDLDLLHRIYVSIKLENLIQFSLLWGIFVKIIMFWSILDRDKIQIKISKPELKKKIVNNIMNPIHILIQSHVV